MISMLLQEATSRTTAAVLWVFLMILGIALVSSRLDVRMLKSELNVSTLKASRYEAQLSTLTELQTQQALRAKEAQDQAREVASKDRSVIKIIREAVPGSDACASAHQLILQTLKGEQQQ